MTKLLTVILAAVITATSMVGCNKTTGNNPGGEEVSSSYLTLKEIASYVSEKCPLNENDKTVVAKIGDDHEISATEYRYNYVQCKLMMCQYSGFDWEENEESKAEFDRILGEALKMPYIVEKLAKQYNAGLTKADIDEKVFPNYDDFVAEYGEEAENMMVNDYYASPFFLCYLESFYNMYNDLYEAIYKTPGEKFEEIKSKTLGQIAEKEMIRAKHVLVLLENEDGSEVTEEQKAEKLARAEEILAKAKNGEDFDALIAEYNEDRGMNPTGYLFGKGQMVAPFEEAAYALEEGGISDVVESEYGYHIIQRLPIDDETIKASSIFDNFAYEAFTELVMAEVEATEVTFPENFDELVAPIHEEATNAVADLKLQYDAYMGAISESTTEETAEGETEEVVDETTEEATEETAE